MYSATENRERFFGRFFLGFAIIVPLSLLTIRSLVPASAILLENMILHTFLEALASFLAITVGVLLYGMQKRFNRGTKLLWMSCSMLSMGILMGIHAIAAGEENGMRAIELSSSFAGGALACLCLLPHSFCDSAKGRRRALSVTVLTTAILGTSLVVFADRLPAFVVNGHFTPLNTYLGLSSGAAFLVAAGRCFSDYLRCRRVKDLYLTDFLLLSGLSTVIPSGEFYMWGPLWWMWHLIQMLSFVSIIFLFLNLAIQFQKELAVSEERFRSLTQELERSNQELKNFATFASHDLKEPVRTIQAHLTLLERRCRHQLDRESLEFIHFAVDAAFRMRRMIEGFLYYARHDVIGPKDAQAVDLNKSLAQAVDNLRLLITETHAQIRVEPLPSVKGDPAQLSELFQNIVSNAIKFRCASRAPEVSISSRQVGERWEISFRDNGIGIPTEHLSSIFELLKRLHGNEIEGCGLGLAICKRIVERHGGEIHVESEVGQSTTVKILLPVLLSQTGEAPHLPETLASSSSSAAAV